MAGTIARPIKSYNTQTSFTDGFPTVSDFNLDPDAIVSGVNALIAEYNAHASRHAAGGADPLTPASIGATTKAFAFFMSG